MDPLVDEVLTQQSDEAQFYPRQSSGLATPLMDPSSPFPPGSADRDMTPQTRLSYAERIRRFQRYMYINGVDSMKAADDYEVGDADNFYDVDAASQTNVCYVKRPYEFSDVDDIAVSESCLNCYEIYDIHRIQGRIPIDPLIHQPGLKYDDSLIIEKWHSLIPVENTEFMEYKMNLTECFGRYIFICSYDTIVVLKDEKILKKFETRPRFTTREHLDASVIRFAPHSINYLKLSTFKGTNVLIACYDDGRASLYDLDKFIRDEELHLIFQVRLNSSVWGADSEGDFLVFSDNSHTVSLFYVKDGYVYFSQSLQLMHNIPAIAIVNVSERSIHISCACISGELVTFRFDVKTEIAAQERPLVQPMIVNIQEVRAQIRYSISHKVVNRLMLQDSGWTIHNVNERDFKEVYNPEYLGVESGVDTIKVLKNSRVLGLLPSHLCTSDLGGAASFENLHTRTRFDSENRALNRLNPFSDKFNRIKKAYFETDFANQDYIILKDRFLITTTVSKAGIYRASNLICNSDTGDLFEFQLPGDLEYSNRLSITKVIPELSLVIVASQAGFFTIFRLVKHRGLHSLREEYVEPFDCNREEMLDGETITGIGVRKLGSDTFWIYVSYTSGNIHKFEIRERNDDFLDNTVV